MPDEDIVVNNETSDEEVLNQEEKEKKEKVDDKEEKVDEEKSDDIEEEDELEDEDEEDDKEDKDDLKVFARPSIKEIKAKYPKLFEDFPDIKEALYREQQFNRVFPTMEDAQEAQEKSNIYDNMSGLVLSGKREDLGKFIESIGETDKDTIKNFASNILPVLYNISQNDYFTAITPVLESAVKNMYREGVNLNNDNLKNAALLAAKYILGDQEIASSNKSTVPKEDKEGREKIDKELHEHRTRVYNETLSRITDKSKKLMVKAIEKDFDPSDSINDDLKEILVKRVMDEVDEVLFNDVRHRNLINGLWRKAFNAGFVGNWEARITTAYLARARAVMPAIRSRIRAKALNQKVSEAERIKKTSDNSSRKEIQSSGKIPNQNLVKFDPNKAIDYNKTSDMDILNDKIAYKN